MDDAKTALMTLHDMLVDSRNGYDEAVKAAKHTRMALVLNDMIALRTTHIGELGLHLHAMGKSVEESGTFMSTVHRTIIDIRSLLTGGIDEKALAAFVDGEVHILKQYDVAIAETGGGRGSADMLRVQCDVVATKVEAMRCAAAAVPS